MPLKEFEALGGKQVGFEHLGPHNEIVKVTGLSDKPTYFPLADASQYITDALIEILHHVHGRILPNQPSQKIEELNRSLHALTEVEKEHVIFAAPPDVKQEEISVENPFRVEFDPPDSGENPRLIVGNSTFTAVEAFNIGAAILNPQEGWNSANPPPQEIYVHVAHLMGELNDAYDKAAYRGEVPKRAPASE